jgi:hypothetical protein
MTWLLISSPCRVFFSHRHTNWSKAKPAIRRGQENDSRFWVCITKEARENTRLMYYTCFKAWNWQWIQNYSHPAHTSSTWTKKFTRHSSAKNSLSSFSDRCNDSRIYEPTQHLSILFVNVHWHTHAARGIGRGFERGYGAAMLGMLVSVAMEPTFCLCSWVGIWRDGSTTSFIQSRSK